MQLFTLFYSGIDAITHPCKMFPMCPLWSVRWHKFENAFFLRNHVRFLKVFAPQRRTFNRCQLNLVDEGDWRSP